MYPKVNFNDLQFRHIVVSDSTGIIFASARAGKRVENFLINPKEKLVKIQVNHHFERLPQDKAELILALTKNSQTAHIFHLPDFEIS